MSERSNELLAAALRKPWAAVGGSDKQCFFCGIRVKREAMNHEPDCPVVAEVAPSLSAAPLESRTSLREKAHETASEFDRNCIPDLQASAAPPSEREAFEKWAKDDYPTLPVPDATAGIACAFRAGWQARAAVPQDRASIEQQAAYYFGEIRKFSPLNLDHYSLENWKDFIAWREAAAVPAPWSEETGWLIEKGRLCLGSSRNKPAWVTFTDPTAIRFARREDAENMMNSLRSMSGKGAFESCTINDHMWAGATAPPKEAE